MALGAEDYRLRAFQISSYGRRLDHSSVATSGYLSAAPSGATPRRT
jgi:hypothetical protein